MKPITTLPLRWDALETEALIQLRNSNHTPAEIVIALNKKFNTNRTKSAISKKIELLFKARWTQELDKIIIKYVQSFPLNLQHAFVLASKDLNISKLSIQGRYYAFIRINYNVLTTGSLKTGFSNNIKNLSRKSNKLPDQKLNTVMWLMKQILELPKEEREKIKSFLKD